MFIFLLRILLIFWIISVVVRWVERLLSPGRGTPPVTGRDRQKTDPPLDITAERIEDAEYTDLDDRT